MDRTSRRSRTVPATFTVQAAPRDACCAYFHAQVCVGGRVAFSYTYRLRANLVPQAMGHRMRVRNPRRFARLFGWRDFSHAEAAVLLRVFLYENAGQLAALSSAAHVVAAARTRQFGRIPNALATEHMLLIRKHVRGTRWRRLSAFEMLEEAGEVAPYHWTQAPPEPPLELPDLSATRDHLYQETD
jgi:hypothetical protein